MSKERVLTMLGFGEKSRKIVSGSTGCRISIQKKKAKLLIISEDASQNTKKAFEDLVLHHRVPCLVFSQKELLGSAIGKGSRSLIVIIDDGLAKTIEKLINEITTE